MRILIVVANFIPEIGSAAHLYFDLAKAFVKRGHEVDVITSYPRRFNMDTTKQDNDFPAEEIIEGICIHRCHHPATRDNIVVRGLEHFYIPYYYYRKYREVGKKFDVCLIYIPPLPLYYLGKKIRQSHGTPMILNFQDFHPQELTDVGVLKNPVMIKILEHIERQAYKNADHITVLSYEGIEYVVKKGAHSPNVTHIFNSVSLPEFDAIAGRKDFKRELGVEDKFLVSYAGILSPYQGIDNILDAAKALQDHTDILFCIAGDGSEKQRIEERIKNERIINVRLLPILSRDKYFNLVNSSDLSFIALDERMKAPCIPGKTINLMALEQPILAMVSEESATADIMRKAQCGILVNPGDIEGIRSAILYLKENPSARLAMGNNGRSFLVKNMNLEKNIVAYERIFHTLVGDRDVVNRMTPQSEEKLGG
jgi:glycosyltransferase involved in cell wall biosynthesis